MKVHIKHTETPSFSPPPHLSRPLFLPQPARNPEGFYSMEKLNGSISRRPGPGEVGEMCMDTRVYAQFIY